MKIHTQAELEANINSKEVLEIVAAGVFIISVGGTSAPKICVLHQQAELSVVARESSQPRVVA